MLGAIAVLIFNALPASPQDKLMIDFFDVGQGDSVFVAAPNGNQVLIDGGPSDVILEKLGRQMPLSDKKIELLVLTHPDADHLDGLLEVLKRYEVGGILETGIKDDTAEYKIWNEEIKNKKIPVFYAKAGEKIIIADNFYIEIFYPFGNIAGQDFSGKTNASSIVGKIHYGQNSVLFTGDAEKDAEYFLVRSKFDLKADILQIAHHGSKNSSTQEFLDVVAPDIAVIQVGAKNRYGHPAPETLFKLSDIDILRTDQSGDIIFECNLDNCVKLG